MPHERCRSGRARCTRWPSGLLSSRRCSWSRHSRYGGSGSIRLCSGRRRLLRRRWSAGALSPGRRCCRGRRSGLRWRSRRSSWHRPLALGRSPSRRGRLLRRRWSAGTLCPGRRCCRRCGLAVRCRSRRRSRRRPLTGDWPCSRPFTGNRPLARSRSLVFPRLHGRRGRRPRRLRGGRRRRMRHLGWSVRRRRCWRRRALGRGCAWRRRLRLFRGPRRCPSGRRRTLRRCNMGRSGRYLRRRTFRCPSRRLLFMLVLTPGFALRLCELNSRRLRIRCQGCELHRRQGRRGKQHETKFCHDGPNPPGRSFEKPHGGWTDQQPAMGPHCGTCKSGTAFYLHAQALAGGTYSSRIQSRF